MKPLQYILFLFLLQSVSITNAQDFKVIKDTKDYILKEVDSVYYYTHGIEPKNDFVIDTTKIHKVNGVLKLPLDNGQIFKLKDIINKKNSNFSFYNYIGYNSRLNIYLAWEQIPRYDEGIWFIIHKTNG